MQQLCPKINPRNSTTIHCLTSIQYLSGKGGDYYYILTEHINLNIIVITWMIHSDCIVVFMFFSEQVSWLG